MRTISYKRNSMLGQSIGCIVLAVGGAWLAYQTNFGPMTRTLGGFLAVSLPFVSIALFIRSQGDGVALRFDGREIRISTLFKSATLSWSDVRGISREVLTQSGTFGLFKQEIAHYLVIEAAQSGGFERFQIQEELLDLPKDGMSRLVDELSGLWSARHEAVRRGLPDAAEQSSLPDAPTFDADAAIARYMAQRTTQPEETPSAAPVPARPAFGRKGLSA